MEQPTETRPFKQGINKEEARRKRENVSLNYRKQRRTETLTKKRKSIASSPGDENLKDLNIHNLLLEFVSGDLELVVRNLGILKRILSLNSIASPIKEVIAAPKVVDMLIEILNRGTPDLQLDAAWCITNLCSGDRDDTDVFVQAGVIQLLTNNITHINEEIREQCVWALGNIGGECIEYRDMVIESGALTKMLRNFDTARDEFYKIFAWVISNLSRGKPKPKWDKVEMLVPYLCNLLLETTDPEILIDSSWSLSYLSDRDDKSALYKILNHLDCQRLIGLLRHPNDDVLHPILRIIGNFASGTDKQTEIILGFNTLRTIRILLTENHHKKVVKECCWILSNVTAIGQSGIIQVLNERVQFEMQPLLKPSKKSDWPIRKESFYFFFNIITEGNEDQIDLLFQTEFFDDFCSFLDAKDPKIIVEVLESLIKLLKIGSSYQSNVYAEQLETNGTKNYIEENLLFSEVESIRETCQYIVVHYFSNTDMEFQGTTQQSLDQLYSF
jgi:hypothetical protein